MAVMKWFARLSASPTLPPPADAAPGTGRASDSFSLTTTGRAPAPLKVWQAAFVISLWLASVGNLALWKAIANLGGLSLSGRWVLGLSLGAAITCACWAIANLLSWGRASKAVMLALCWIAAFAASFMLNYGISIDASMLTNVLQTDLHEAGDLLHWNLFVTIGAIAIPPTWWLSRQKLQRNGGWRALLRQLGMVLLATVAMVLVVLAGFAPISSAMRNHTQLRFMMNPLSSLYAAGNLVAQKVHQRDTTVYPIGEDAKLGASYTGQAQFPIYVLVVGETGRAVNFAVNGYARPTTPELSARNDLAIAQNAWACGTNTAVSLPCMFSHLGRAGQSDSKSYENLLDVLQRAGLAVLWVDNQSGCKGVCARVNSASTTANPKALAGSHASMGLSAEQMATLCNGGECVDMALLENLEDRINALPAEQRAHGVVLVLHQMGSHGPAYFKRSLAQDKKFGPECTNVALQSCEREAVINAYDNSIVATDRMLGGLLQWLERKGQRQPTAMMYVADHGESLGENNIYLHGLPYSVAPDVQKHVPWITWLSPLMQQRMGVSTACLQQAVGQAKISHDNYFHSVLGLADVQTKLHNPQLDIFASCAGSMRPAPVAQHATEPAKTAPSAAAPAELQLAAVGAAMPQSAPSPKPSAPARNPAARKPA